MKRILPILIALLWHAVSASAQHLSFAENKGQWAPQILFRAEIPNGALFLTTDGPVYNFAAGEDLIALHDALMTTGGQNPGQFMVKQHAYMFRFLSGTPASEATGSSPITYYENFFIGADSSRWVSHVQHFQKVLQKQVFEQIDLSFYSKGKDLKYDFIVHPKGKPQNIRMRLEGAPMLIDEHGRLIISTTVNQVTEDNPYAYQIINKDTIEVACKFKVENDILSFDLGHYNPNYTLVIDPNLIFSTYSGATSTSFYSYTSTYDNDGNTIIAALALGVGWPVSLGAYNNNFAGAFDVAVMKISPDGSNKLFATYLGSPSQDYPLSLTTNQQNNIYIAGHTDNAFFPITAGAAQPLSGGLIDMFISKLSSDGTQLMGSTYLGGAHNDGNLVMLPPNFANNKSPIAIRFHEPSHTLWLVAASISPNFPTTPNALLTINTDTLPVLVQIDSSLQQILYSTFIPANGRTSFQDLKFAANNKLYLAGGTVATNMGTVGALNPNFLGGETDGIVIKFDINSKAITAATYLGSADADIACKLAIEPISGKVYIGGNNTAGSYPATPALYNEPDARNYIQMLDSNLSQNLGAATFGTQNLLAISDMFIAPCKALGIAGMSFTPAGLPLTPDAFSTSGEFWLGNFNQSLTTVPYGTRYGYGGHTHSGTFHFDAEGNIHHSVCDVGGNFLTTANAWAPFKITNGFDMVSFKFNIMGDDSPVDFELAFAGDTVVCNPDSVSFINYSVNQSSYYWDFGNGQSSTDFEPIAYYDSPGLYQILLTATSTLCNTVGYDSVFIRVLPSGNIHPFISDTTVCGNVQPVILHLDSISPQDMANNYSIQWVSQQGTLTPAADGLSAALYSNQPQDITIHFIGIDNNNTCFADTSVTISVRHFDSSGVHVQPSNALLCSGDSVLITAAGGQSYLWEPDDFLSFVAPNSAFASPYGDINYTIYITDSNGCHYTREVPITVAERPHVDAGQDVTIRSGEAATLMGHTTAAEYYWQSDGTNQFHNILSPTLYPSEDSTLYYLYAVSELGCTHYDSVWVFVTDMRSPNAFTPNGDGRNDVFYPLARNRQAKVKVFQVFNRYGQLVYYTIKTGQGWDGTMNNRACDAGVYFYYLEYTIGDRQYVEKGDVTLIR